MRPSWRLALNQLAARRWRTALLAGAVALSSALIVAVACAMASLQASVEARLVQFLGAADVRIIHPGNGRFDAALLETATAWPETNAAAGRIGSALTLVRADGGTDPETGRPRRSTPFAIGIDPEREQRLRPIELAAGRMPAARDEIVIDPFTAEALGAVVGDRLDVQRFGDPIALRVVGVYARKKLPAIQRPVIYALRELVAEASGREGLLTAIYVDLADGTDAAAFCAAHAAEIPPPLVLEPAELARAGFDRSLRAGRLGLAIAATLTFLSAAFIVVTGLTTGVSERERELAVLRAVGASRLQLFGAQLVEGTMLGALGAVAGLPLGAACAGVLVAWFREYLPAGLTLHGPGIALAAVGALLAGAGGALYPALLAARVTPLRAMSNLARPARPRGPLLCGAVGALLVALHLAALAPDDVDTRFWAYVAGGLPALLIGTFLLAVPLTLGLAVLLARPLAWMLRLPADLVRGPLRAAPFRHGFTAGALMMGVALHVDTWSAGAAYVEHWLARVRFADGFAYRATGMSPEQQEAIAALPFVEETCPIGYLPVRIVGRQVFGVQGLSPSDVICIGFDPDRFLAMNELQWIEGDPSTAVSRLRAGDGVIVAERFLVAKDIGVGDTITLGVGNVEQDFEIVGVVGAAGLDIAMQIFGVYSAYLEYAVSCVFLDFETVARVFDNSDAYMLQVNLADDVSDADAEIAIEDAAPGVEFRSGREILQTIRDLAYTVLSVQSTIAFAALLLASLAVGNVVAAGIHGRRFEFGVLRAIGGGRGVLLRAILADALLLAAGAAVVGTALGYRLGMIDATFARDLGGLGGRVTLAPVPVLLGWLVLTIVTIAAAMVPAVRLARSSPAGLVASGRNE